MDQNTMKKLRYHALFLCACLMNLTGIFGFVGAEDMKAENIKEEPRCHSNKDCQKPGMRGICQNPGEETASCIFEEIAKIDFFVIVPKDCRTCNTAYVVDGLKAVFPGLETVYLDSDNPRAVKMIKDLHVEMLPAYVLSKEVEKDSNFARFSALVDRIKDQYYVKPSSGGVSYFLGRQV